MISIENLSLRRGSRLLLENADALIYPQERVGLVGSNGAGKTSLLSCLLGYIDPDQGDYHIPKDWRIAAIEQEITDTSIPARDFVMQGDQVVHQLQLAKDTAVDDMQRAEIESGLLDAQAFSLAARAEALLLGLGFSADTFHHPLHTFSGGWQMRLNLARALIAPSDCLLLDEPTNHLDIDALLWLEQWLRSYPGTVITISHDHDFLDNVCNVIVHIEHQKLHRYKGNYQSFQQQRQEKIRLNQAQHAKQQRERQHLQKFIDRFKAKASKAKQAQSRVKALEKMQDIPLWEEEGSSVHIELPEPSYLPDPLMTLEHAVIGYHADHPLFADCTLQVRAGDRIGILGVNGAGKSTLIKTLVGDLPLLDGRRHLAKGVRLGYFAQHQLETLIVEHTPLDHLSAIAPDAKEQELRNFLGRFGFTGNRVHEAIAPFSGGEKARLALALMVWQEPNVLILDEPTNHLDAQTRAALTEALACFGGSLLLVSHDRQLLRNTADQLWLVSHGQVSSFEGDLEDYQSWVQAQYKATAQSAASEEESPQNRKEQRKQAANDRQRLQTLRKPLEKKIQTLEKRMQTLQEEKSTLDAAIADPNLYTEAEKERCLLVLEQHRKVQEELSSLEENWLELQAEWEAIV